MTSAVLVIEPAVRYFHLPHTRFFFTVHLPCLVLFFSFLILATVFNGQKKRRLHNIFAPLAIVFGMVTIITGDMLVYHQLWLYS